MASSTGLVWPTSFRRPLLCLLSPSCGQLTAPSPPPPLPPLLQLRCAGECGSTTTLLPCQPENPFDENQLLHRRIVFPPHLLCLGVNKRSGFIIFNPKKLTMGVAGRPRNGPRPVLMRKTIHWNRVFYNTKTDRKTEDRREGPRD